MKLLLTSNGLCNKSIVNALADLLGKTFEKSSIAFIPTAANVEEGSKHWLINDLCNCVKTGFQTVDIVDISALTKEQWQPRLESADVLLFGGGNTRHLSFWIEKSGLIKLLPNYLKTKVYVGISAGSIVMGKNMFLSNEEKFYYEHPNAKKTGKFLNIVDFSIRPHLNNDYFPQVNKKNLKVVAKEHPEPIYALDDESAIMVRNNKVDVVTEGKWLKFN